MHLRTAGCRREWGLKSAIRRKVVGAVRSQRSHGLALLQALPHDVVEPPVRQGQYIATHDVQCELLDFGIARSCELVRESAGRLTETAAEPHPKPFEELRCLRARGRFQRHSKLKPAPCGPVEQFTVVGRTDRDDVRRKPIDL